MQSAYSIYLQGPLPVQTPFTSYVDGTAVVFVAGSMYRGGSPGFGGVSLTIDGQPVASSQIYLNATDSHAATPGVFVEVPMTAGIHLLGVSATNGDLTTDSNDWFSAAVFFF